ncbi:MAG: hypothetical protein ACYCTW_13230 [Sulfuricella sp.]
MWRTNRLDGQQVFQRQDQLLVDPVDGALFRNPDGEDVALRGIHTVVWEGEVARPSLGMQGAHGAQLPLTQW